MLDTHVALGLYDGHTRGLGAEARRAIDRGDVAISPVVLLEIEILHEIKRLRQGARAVAAALAESLDIRVAAERFSDIAIEALSWGFTRDPFDRLIVAHASLAKAALITQDSLIRFRYPKALA
jgi:PIN domain nuclease of toxin-antitoxin system